MAIYEMADEGKAVAIVDITEKGYFFNLELLTRFVECLARLQKYLKASLPK